MYDLLRFAKGLVLEPSKTMLKHRRRGSVHVNQDDGKVHLFDTTFHRVVTHDQAETLENKSIDANRNPLSNIDIDSFDPAIEIPTSMIANTDRLDEAITFFNVTDITGAQANTLIGGNNATTLHTHDDRYYTETELNNGSLDGRYYTETEVNTIDTNIRNDHWNKTNLASVVDNSSGADKIGVTSISNVTGNTVQAVFEAITAILNKDPFILNGASGSDIQAIPVGAEYNGNVIYVKAIDVTNPVKITSVNLIDGSTEYEFTRKYESVILKRYNNTWYIL